MPLITVKSNRSLISAIYSVFYGIVFACFCAPGIAEQQRLHGSCSSGWTKSGNSCIYYSSSKEQLPQGEAVSACQKLGAKLSSISSADEWLQFAATIKGYSRENFVDNSEESISDETDEEFEDYLNDGYWIGLWKNQPSRSADIEARRDGWRWLDGSPTNTSSNITGGFTEWIRVAWARGVVARFDEPTGDSKCARIELTGYIGDLDCREKLRYICRKIPPKDNKTTADPGMSLEMVTFMPQVAGGEGPSDKNNKDRLALYSIPATIGLVAIIVGVASYILIKKRKQHKNGSVDQSGAVRYEENHQRLENKAPITRLLYDNNSNSDSTITTLDHRSNVNTIGGAELCGGKGYYEEINIKREYDNNHEDVHVADVYTEIDLNDEGTPSERRRGEDLSIIGVDELIYEDAQQVFADWCSTSTVPIPTQSIYSVEVNVSNSNYPPSFSLTGVADEYAIPNKTRNVKFDDPYDVTMVDNSVY